MSRVQNFSQFQLFSLNIEQYLPRDHWVFLLDEILSSLDFSELYWKSGFDARNNESYEKELLAKLWLAGYFKKISSCRQLEESCGVRPQKLVKVDFLYNQNRRCSSTE